MESYLNFRGGLPWLSLLIFTPLAGALLAALTPQRRDGRVHKWGTLLLSLAPLGIALFLAATYRGGTTDSGLQQAYDYAERLPWIRVLGIAYTLGLDGTALPLVLLTTLLTPLTILAAFDLNDRPRYFLALLLTLESAILGILLALNFFLFFSFWEVSLIPSMFLISSWGGAGRHSAAMKFMVYTMAASVGMLLAFQFLYVATGTFDLPTLMRLARGLPVARIQGTLPELVFGLVQRLGLVNILGGSADGYMNVLFAGTLIALVVKLGIWPFHTWLPDAYVEAPTAAAMLIGGVLTKMGAFAMLRVLLPIFPLQMQRAAGLLGFLAFMSIIGGAWNAYTIARVPRREETKCNDMKRLIAYLSINHMGYVVLAIAAAAAAASPTDPNPLDSRAIAINGAVVQMFAHGLSISALFFLVGRLAKRTGSYDLSAFGGLQSIIPQIAGLMGIAVFAYLGLPTLAGFVGEFFIFRGAWATLPLWTIGALPGLVVSALALLQMYQRIFSGPRNHRLERLPDVGLQEWTVLLPLVALLIGFGLYPLPLTRFANETALVLSRFFPGG